MKDSRLWWRIGLDTGLALMTLGTSAPWDTPKGKPRVYRSDGFEFHESEIKGHYDEIEEALFAFRNGLSDVVFEIKISKRLAAKLGRD